MIQNKCKIIGLTGGIGSGKTSAKNILQEKGYVVVDSDLIARQVVEKNKPAYFKVIEEFGQEILGGDKTIDRKALGDIIFKDVNKRKTLEGILYPYIFEEIKREVELNCTKKSQVIFIDIPLLFENIGPILESGIKFDMVWLIYCDRNTQIERLIKRNNISKEKALLRINAQMDIEKKKELADLVIENMTTKEQLRKDLFKSLSALEKEKIWRANCL